MGTDHKHGEMDIKVQEETFDGFVQWVTWTLVAILAVVLFMAVFAI
jgi:hypothetical protein